MTRPALLLVALLGLSQAACPAYLLSRIGPENDRSESVVIPPLERDAQLRCAEADCAGIEVARTTRRGNSKGVFAGVLVAETLGAGGATLAGALVASSGDGFWSSLSSVLASFPLFLVGGTLATMAIVDLAMLGIKWDGFGPQKEPPLLVRPATATWNGVTVPLEAADVWPPTADLPPPRFSVERAVAARLGARAPKAVRGRLAVLDFKSFAPELRAENVRYFADLVRAAALQQGGWRVITRENLVALLQAAGQDLAACEGECEIETGRRIGADLVVSGELQRLGAKYRLSLRLHDTAEGRLLSTAFGSGATVDELDEVTRSAAKDLLQALGKR